MKSEDSKDLPTSPGKPEIFWVNAKLDKPLHLDMLCDRKFLEDRSPRPAYRQLFLDAFPPEPTGFLLKKENVWTYFPSKHAVNGRTELKGPSLGGLHDGDFDFDWGKPFQIIMLGQSFGYGKGWVENDPIRFPAEVVMSELGMLSAMGDWVPGAARSGAVGPAYPVEFYFHSKSEILNAHANPKSSELASFFRLNNMMGPDDDLKISSLGMIKNGFLFGANLNFHFSIEGPHGKMVSKQGVKPFGGRHIKPKEGSYRYGLSLQTVAPLGLNLNHILEFSLPGVPDNLVSGTLIQEVKNLVEQASLHEKISIEKSDLEL